MNQQQEKLQVVQRFEATGNGSWRSASEGYSAATQHKDGRVHPLPEGDSAWAGSLDCRHLLHPSSVMSSVAHYIEQMTASFLKGSLPTSPDSQSRQQLSQASSFLPS